MVKEKWKYQKKMLQFNRNQSITLYVYTTLLLAELIETLRNFSNESNKYVYSQHKTSSPNQETRDNVSVENSNKMDIRNIPKSMKNV